jgi:hypothetical protein
MEMAATTYPVETEEKSEAGITSRKTKFMIPQNARSR